MGGMALRQLAPRRGTLPLVRGDDARQPPELPGRRRGRILNPPGVSCRRLIGNNGCDALCRPWPALWMAIAFAACDPPGKGPKAERGYRRSAPVIAALDRYRAEHGQYPDSLR